MRLQAEELNQATLRTCLQLLPKLSRLTFELVASDLLLVLPVIGTLTALRELYLKNTGFEKSWRVRNVDAGQLAALTQLQVLSLSGLYVDVANVMSLTTLRSLSLDCYKVQDFGRATALSALQELRLYLTVSPDIRLLGAFTKLRKLELPQVVMSDLAPLTALTALRSLHVELDRHSVHDVRPVAALTSLHLLRLNGLLGDIGPLTTITGLQALGLTNSMVADIGPLAAFKVLRKLDLSWSHIKSGLSPLASLTTLCELGLLGTDQLDLNVLTSLVGLTRIDLRGSPRKPSQFASMSPLTGLTRLKQLDLDSSGCVQDQASLALLFAKLHSLEIVLGASWSIKDLPW